MCYTGRKYWQKVNLGSWDIEKTRKTRMPDCPVDQKNFIPMNDRGVHWYLMVVDFSERKMYVLDSASTDERKLLRQRDVLRLMIHFMIAESSYRSTLSPEDS
ncbi:Ulp1 protease family, carboxy-terminal domain protein [Medicago truncatula]|uniref:Ulp1 protease family, carboxy-terminal domain protein n=1 Tax=Medicago truncatula TaxID=3880 RepID=G7KPS5_MEDTR|nr:Ulp1 protease family, carboxy-terminal domain protein [Medicago truncatula]